MERGAPSGSSLYWKILLWGYSYAWDSRSEYKLEGLPDGDWKIGVSSISWGIGSEMNLEEVVWYPENTDWNNAEVFTITDADSIKGITLTAP